MNMNRTNKEHTYGLTAAQREILLGESISQEAAFSVISVKLMIGGHDAAEVKAAADRVISSADIFHVSLHGDGFVQCESRDSVILPPMSRGEAEAYTARRDTERMDPSRMIYEAEVIPTDGYVLLYVRFHHIIMDGRGMCLFAQRVLDALEGKALSDSRFFTPEEEPAQEQDDYWAQVFSDFSDGTSVFSGEPAGFEKLSLPFHLGAVADGAARFADEIGVHVPYVYLAAQALYLARATDSDEATVLMSRLNRNAATAETLGCYTLVVPVRIRLKGCEHFSDLCRRAQETAKEASLHKGAGFSSIARASNVKGAFSEYGFNYYDFKLRTETDCTLSLSVAGALKNHLVWNLFADGECMLDGRAGIYDEETARFFADAMRRILEDGVKDMPLEEIRTLGAEELSRLEQIHGEEMPFGQDETIPSLLRSTAAACPDAPAVYAGDKKLTFRELDEQSDNIARALIDRGVKPGDRVAFMLKRDIRLLPALFGISKSGAAFIPVDPAYPEDRIRYILENSEAALLVTSKDTGSGADIDELLMGGTSPLPDIKQDALAYLIYTSGTTGRPKGVMLTHRGIANIVKPGNNPFNRYFTKHCKGLTAIGSVCFDISLFEFFTALFNGKFVELADEEGMLNPERLASCILAHRADALHCTPSRLASYLRNPQFLNAAESVKAVLSAGEVLPQALVTSLSELGIHVFNGYGPTEVTIGATITESGDILSIGRPIANTGILILGESGRILPYGAAGEICIYGAGLGLGYFKRPEETEKRFTERHGKNVYRTGDLGRLLPDGRLVYIGRSDRQVKLRGLRIELPEIENAMLSFPGVTQAACLVKKSKHSEHLAAFYTADRELSGELKEHISGTLTAYMVPDIFKRLDAMPQTAGGKTDYKALEKEDVDFRKAYRAPSGALETLICNGMAEVLGIDRVGVDDDFFELGGDSLGAMELMLSIEQGNGGKAPEYNDIYRYPTPAMLAEYLAGERTQELYPLTNLNYEGIDRFLKARPRTDKPARRILLTGATGYLGNHILAELLKDPEVEHVYCLARSKRKVTAEKRIQSTLFYYAEDDFSEDGKWSAVEGDISDPALFSEPFDDRIDLIVNCAANVAHFAYGDALSRVNETGVNNLIAYALKTGARLVQISTISVGGMAETARAKDILFTENDFYVGQKIFNEYIYTKFKAEYALLRAAADKGLPVQIMRVGNLQGRISDGEFQMNLRSNGFTRRLSAYIDIGAAPRSLYDSTVEFSPVDEVAGMVLALTESAECGAFHVCPPAETAFSRIFDLLRQLGKPVEIISDEEFARLIQDLKASGEKSGSVEILSIERGNDAYSDIPFSRAYTVERLHALGRSWKEITDEYLEKYLTALAGMDMF